MRAYTFFVFHIIKNFIWRTINTILDIQLKEEYMKKYTILWCGQLLSIIGSAMTRFALLLYVYTTTGNVTATATIGFLSMVPYALISPYAGVIVDRYSRKKVMILSDFGSLISTLLIVICIFVSELNITVIYISTIIGGLCGAFQNPAYQASITMLIPEKYYTRANAMRSFSGYASTMLAPILAGTLIAFIGINGIIIIDVITFMIGILSLLLVRIPKPTTKTKLKMNIAKSKFNTLLTGFHYIKENKGLSLMLTIFVFINFITGITYYGILPAYILVSTGNNQIDLGIVESMLGFGGVIGSILVATMKLPKKKVKVLFILMLISYVVGDFLVGIGTNVYIWGFAVFSTSLLIAFIVTYNNVVWQTIIPPDLQGRTFASRGMMTSMALPIGYLTGGILADYVFEPAFVGKNINILTNLVGNNSGSGMSMMFLLTSIIGVIICIFAIKSKVLMNLDEK